MSKRERESEREPPSLRDNRQLLVLDDHWMHCVKFRAKYLRQFVNDHKALP